MSKTKPCPKCDGTAVFEEGRWYCVKCGVLKDTGKATGTSSFRGRRYGE